MANITPLQMYFDEGKILTEYEDDSIKGAEEIYVLLEKVLGSSFSRIKFRPGQKIATGCYENHVKKKFFFLVANVTFMGGTEGQHPRDLKRIQYNVTWREFYDEFSSEGEVIWMGLYSYKNTNVWALFEPESYLKKHEGKSMISKGGHKAQYSCHIYLNDLFQGIENNFYKKSDRNDNLIGAVKCNYLRQYFEGENSEKNPIIEVIDRINNTQVEWNKWIMASRAITYMKALKKVTGFNQWKQNLWNGWYIEALYSDYLHKNPSEHIDYIATSNDSDVILEYKTTGLDLAFPKAPYHFIGDLKAVCEGDGNTLLNDETRVKKALKKYKRIWFVIYIHEKKQGKTNNYEMVRWRNNFILNEGEWDYKRHPSFEPLSAPRTPHSVAFSEMVIIELNNITKDKYFSIGPQWGNNSDGNERNDKFKISKRMLEEITDDSFVIYRYRPK